MEDAEEIIKLLNSHDFSELMHNMYEISKKLLNPKWQNEDEEIFISYLKAYCVNTYLEINDNRQRSLFVFTLNMGLGFPGLFFEFIEKLNATEAKMFDLIDQSITERLLELKKQVNNPVYKELSKSNKEIAKIIKRYNRYSTIDELKKEKTIKTKNNNKYILTDEEIDIIDMVKNNYQLNQFAHMLYDKKDLVYYECNHTINNSDEILKSLLITTDKDNPELEIIYNDGKIVDYYKGNIRLKPYKFRHIVEYTKMYYSENYDDLKFFFQLMSGEANLTYEISKKMIITSFIRSKELLDSLENIYTKAMIDDSKKEFVKIKKIAKEYDL